MNYTENYHLPQWVKTDRIMMEDFNQMCAEIDAGMSDNAQAAKNACQSNGNLDRKTLSRLQRIAYNHYSMVQNMDPFPWQVGVFHQNPAKDGSGVVGTKLWNGVCFAGKEPAGAALGSLSSYMQETAPMTLVKNDLASCTPLQVDFCVPVNAYMNRIDLGGAVTGNVPNSPFPVRVTLTNLDTGELEASHFLNIPQSIETGALANGFYDCFLPFHAGQHYRLQLDPLAAPYDGDMHLIASDQTPLYPIYNDHTITAVHTMQECEGSSGGLLIVRGMIHGGKLTATWDGQELPLHTVRLVQISDGRLVREMAGYRDGPIPAETTVSLQFTTEAQGSFLFYDWGTILL